MSSTFSPTPQNLMGCPHAARTLSAAPPRASPSSFVSRAPVSPSLSWNALAAAPASCPAMASTTSSVSCGDVAAFTARSSAMSASSI
jgi:hypothetical protein